MALYRSTIRGTLLGETVDVIMGWHTPFTTGAGDALTLAGLISSNWTSEVLPDLSTEYGLTAVDVVGVDDPTVGVSVSTSSAGGNVGGALPAFCVANVQLHTGLRGRSYRGRFGIPGLVYNQVDGSDPNHLSSASVTTLNGDVTSFYSGVASGGVSAAPAVISTISGGTPRPSPIYTTVTSHTVALAIGTRVSRKG